MHPNQTEHPYPPRSIELVRWSRKDPLAPVIIESACHSPNLPHRPYRKPVDGSTYQIWFPETLASTKQLITRRSTDNKVLCKIDTTNAIKPADKRLSTLLIETCNHRANEVGTESLLVQRTGDQVGHCRGRDVALLAETVHVYFVAEEVGDCRHVCGETGQTKVDVAVVEDLGEVVGDGEGLETKSEIAGYGHTVLAYHCYAGTAICGLLIRVSS